MDISCILEGFFFLKQDKGLSHREEKIQEYQPNCTIKSLIKSYVLLLMKLAKSLAQAVNAD